ncbi:MAG TPA: DUF983 domain-containing protein [Longimicrobiales bacterium]|nr:DUF983 domain-containing protein [Longimicrobiales bacterium]
MMRARARKPTDLAELDPRRAATLLVRGARRHCPNCGRGGLFDRWLRMRRACPGCHLVLDRGENDYFIGGFVLNFMGAELLMACAGFVAILLTWPAVPWTAIEIGLLASAVTLPVLTYPFAKTLWLAVDLALRPVRFGDLEGHGENAPEQAVADRVVDAPQAMPPGAEGPATRPSDGPAPR